MRGRRSQNRNVCPIARVGEKPASQPPNEFRDVSVGEPAKSGPSWLRAPVPVRCAANRSRQEPLAPGGCNCSMHRKYLSRREVGKLQRPRHRIRKERIRQSGYSAGNMHPCSSPIYRQDYFPTSGSSCIAIIIPDSRASKASLWRVLIFLMRILSSSTQIREHRWQTTRGRPFSQMAVLYSTQRSHLAHGCIRHLSSSSDSASCWSMPFAEALPSIMRTNHYASKTWTVVIRAWAWLEHDISVCKDQGCHRTVPT